MDLSTNRPITGTRDLSLLALMYLPSHFYHSLPPCTIVSVMSGYSMFLGYSVHIPILQPFVQTIPSAWNASLFPFKSYSSFKYQFMSSSLKPFFPITFLSFSPFKHFKYWSSQDSVFGPLFISCYWVTLVSDFLHPHDFQLPLNSDDSQIVSFLNTRPTYIATDQTFPLAFLNNASDSVCLKLNYQISSPCILLLHFIQQPMANIQKSPSATPFL